VDWRAKEGLALGTFQQRSGSARQEQLPT